MKNTWLLEILEEIEKNEFVGNINLNYVKGEVKKIKKEEFIEKPKENCSSKLS